ncbi:MAG: N-acetylmuramidase domain-containing protein [Gammaproteobacteria bacterium]
MTRQSAVYFNIRALGRRWHLSDLPEEWQGFHILAQADWNQDTRLTAEELLDVDWLSFTEAVRDFQRDHHLTADGKLGSTTLNMLHEVFATPNHRPLLHLGNIALYTPEVPTSEPRHEISFAATPTERRLVSLWNRYGGIIAQQANAYRVPISTALAVFHVESGAAYDAQSGLVIIRFEPHIFQRKSGARLTVKRGDQQNEWDVLQQAYQIAPSAALESTSFGLAQIIGFNAQDAGYDSAQEMLLAFQRSCEEQVKGFFSFLQKNNLLDAVRQQDWQHFTRRYNGPGNVPVYQGRLTQALNTIDTLIEDGAELIA